MSRDYPRGALICFHCNQTGHKKVDCTRLLGGAVTTPALDNLRITDGRQGKVYAPMVKINTFQLSTDEAQATLDMVTIT